MPACINSYTWGTRICCRLLRVNAYDQQKVLEWCWNEYLDEIVQSYDSQNRQWRSADAWRGNGVCERIGHSWLWKSSKKRQQYYRVESFAMKTDTQWKGSMVKNHISLERDFGCSATRRTSFLLWFQACQIRLQDLLHQLQGHFQDRRVIVPHLPQVRLHHLQLVIPRLENESTELKVTPLQWLLSTTVDDRSGRSDIDQAI